MCILTRENAKMEIFVYEAVDLELEHNTKENTFIVLNKGIAICQFPFGQENFTLCLNNETDKNILKRNNYLHFKGSEISVIDNKPTHNIPYTVENLLNSFKRLGFRIK